MITGGYDKILRLWDIRSAPGAKPIRTLVGHAGAVCSVDVNLYGNLLVSGSKDNSIKFWDLISGITVRTLTSHLGEVTSVSLDDTGCMVLSSSKDNSNRLWDLRTSKPVRRFKGHQNTYRNLVRASFGPACNFVVSGSEDGLIYMWDVGTAKLVARLAGHSGGTTYQAVWNTRQVSLASCGDDCAVRTWWHDEIADSSGSHPLQ